MSVGDEKQVGSGIVPEMSDPGSAVTTDRMASRTVLRLQISQNDSRSITMVTRKNTPQLPCNSPAAPTARTWTIKAGTHTKVRRLLDGPQRHHYVRFDLTLADDPSYCDRNQLRFEHMGYEIIVWRRHVK